ncbi:MAG TPA: tricarballylate utilization 4Fe-4S protein TcuB [Thermohalobaculum sp.]|nr:tricarballylate utilization 4Fe-4S protein TcuB [Thermohalobaculum sp.]
MSATEMSTTEPLDAPSTPVLAEARRVMEICNACRYCEGYCPVFPAMERRRAFPDGDLTHLANLCHNCKGCWYACQYAPPHEFGVNLPRTFAELRAESWEAHAWPRPLARLFQRNGLWLSLATALALALVLILSMLLTGPGVFTGVHRGEGAFYAVIPYEAMVAVGTLTFGYAVLAMVMGALSYWRAAGGGRVRPADVVAALRAAATTRHLDGGGAGCNDTDERYRMGRRHLHLATMWGFLLCFAATCVATVMDHGLGWVAPYSWYSLPVLLGTVGGVGLTIGPAGLFWLKITADREPSEPRHLGMEHAFLALLFFTATSGLALLLFRHTSAMGGLLALHLGFVLALFLVLPYSKMVHGVYRLLALVREAGEAAEERREVIGLQAEGRG